MTPNNQFISDETIHALAWTVVHSFWQGLLIALIFSLCISNMKNKTARHKYYLSLGALFSIAITAAFTFFTIHDSIIASSPEVFLVPTHTITDITQSQSISTQQGGNWYESTLSFIDANSSSIVFVWMIGLVIFMSRMIYGFYFIKQLRFSASSLGDKKWQHFVDRLLVNMGSAKSVEIAQSALVKMPMMIGFIKPIILFPVGVINAMEAEEVEAIIAHELSHVMRNDYFINIIQSFVEVIFYYHPAVWWISSIVRTERENACDDMAIAMTRSNVTYAKALLHIGQQNAKVNPFAMTFGGKKKKLLLRVQRILNQSQYKPRVMEKIITSTLLFVLIVGISMGANTHDISTHELIDNGSIPSDRVESPVVNTFAERPDANHHFIEVDTLPSKGKGACQMMYYNNDVRVDIWKEHGEIVKLWIDGKRIDEADYGKYSAYIDEAPVPPIAPPAPPVAPNPPVPPAPPSAPVKSKRKNGDTNKVFENAQALQLQKEIEMHEILRQREKSIQEELMALSEITFIDSLNPTLEISDLVSRSNRFNLDLSNLQSKSELEDMINKSLSEIDQSILIEERFNKSFIELEKFNDSLSLHLHDLADFQLALDENMLAYEYDLNNEISDLSAFLNDESRFELSKLTAKNKNAHLNNRFQEELLRDGLISNVESYSFKLSLKSFKINGTKTNEATKQKYLDILYKLLEIAPNSQIKYNRTVRPGKTTMTIES